MRNLMAAIVTSRHLAARRNSVVFGAERTSRRVNEYTV